MASFNGESYIQSNSELGINYSGLQNNFFDADIEEALKTLAKIIVENLDVTFCQILLFDKDKNFLAIRGGHVTERSDPLTLRTEQAYIEQPLSNKDLLKLIYAKEPVIFIRGQQDGSEVLDFIGQRLEMNGYLNSSLFLPIWSGKHPLGLCVLGEMRKWDRSPIITSDINFVKGIAFLAATLIEKINQYNKRKLQIELLYRISNYLQGEKNLEKNLFVVMAGITAGYGLGFNRAALFLLDESDLTLNGQIGVGWLYKKDAERDWEDHHRRGMENFDAFLRKQNENSLPPTPIGENIRNVHIKLDQTEQSLFSRAVTTKSFQIITDRSEMKNFPTEFLKLFHPDIPLIILPLVIHDHINGILVVDNKFTHSEVSDELLTLLQMMVNTAAVAIENHKLNEETQSARKKLKELFLASNTLVSSDKPDVVMQNILIQAQKAAGANWSSVLIINGKGSGLRSISTKIDTTEEVRKIVRPYGISMQVMQTGKCFTIENTEKQRPDINPRMFRYGVAAALCLPLSLREKRIGVMWLHYDQPQSFPEFIIDALQLYANQAAIAYDNASRIDKLEKLRKAADAVVRATTSEQVF